MTNGRQMQDTDTSNARFTYEPVPLPDGWRGEVLTDLHGAAPIAATDLPRVDEWSEPLGTLIGDPERMPGCEFLKHAKTTQVLRATLEFSGTSMRVICKRTSPGGTARRLAARLTGSRARRNRARAMSLLRAGVGTALPLAIVERGGSSACEWLISEEIPDTVDLDQVALTLLPGLSLAQRHAAKVGLTPLLVDLFARLEANGLRHRDLKASNFLITNWDGGAGGEPAVWIVDLDGLRTNRLPIRGASAGTRKGITRLAASLLDYDSITRADYGRFLISLLDRTGVGRGEWKQQFRAIAMASRQYANASSARKGHKLDGFAGA